MNNIGKSPKELVMDTRLVDLAAELSALVSPAGDLPVRVVKSLIANPEVEAIQDYANNVAISRLGFNDHGPVHMRTVCRNAMKNAQDSSRGWCQDLPGD
jgi:Uncharacterized conserved protein